ncbi:MAG TPA: EamA/RhaT family transporter [Clostridiales bacterium]|nr:EamA/RhaT family transporter [Clostridiales bacterium]
MNFIKKSNATYLLMLNAILWGSSYVLNKLLLQSLPLFTVLFLFSLGGFLSTAILFRDSIKAINKQTIIRSLPVSGFSIVSNTFCMLSLQRNDSSITAFVVQTSVIITPLLMALYEKRKPEGKMITNAMIALAGIFFITVRFEDFQFNFNILFSLCNALFFSLYLTGQKVISDTVEPKQFTIVHYFFNSLVFLGPTLAEYGIKGYSGVSLSVVPLIIAGLFFAVFTVIIQTGAIVYVKPEKAALLYTLEPVTALVAAALIAGERPDGIKTLIGCGLILLSMVVSVVSPKTVKPRGKQEEIEGKMLQKQVF